MSKTPNCEWYSLSLDKMYRDWRAAAPDFALTPEGEAAVHAAFVAGAGVFLRGFLHLCAHPDPEDGERWLLRAHKESEIFMWALRETGLVNAGHGLGPVVAEAARLLVEEGRESVVRYDPQGGEVRFKLELSSISPPGKAADPDILKAFLAGWKPGSGGGQA